MHLFVAQVKNLVQLKGDQTVQNNLNTALRGTAQVWYIAELSKLEHFALCMDTSNQANLWCILLMKQFKGQSGVVLLKLTNKKYTLKNARNQWQPVKYVQAIVHHAKEADIEAVYNQLTFAYKSIAVELWVFVNPPILGRIILEFIQTLEVKKPAWFALHTQASTAIANQSQPTQP